MGVTYYSKPGSEGADGVVSFDGTNALYFSNNVEFWGVGMGGCSTGLEMGWFMIDPVNKAQGYAPADAWFDTKRVYWSQGYAMRPDHLVVPWYIHGVDENDHAVPTTTGTWDTDHGLLTDAIVWDAMRYVPRQGFYQSENVASIITELCGRAGWVSGYAMGFHFDTPETERHLAGWRYGPVFVGGASYPIRLWVVDNGEIWARPIGTSVWFSSYGALSSASSNYFTGWNKGATLQIPYGAKIGEVLLGCIATADDATYTWPAGWTVLRETQYNSVVSLSIAWHKVDGTEGECVDIPIDAVEEYHTGTILRITRCADPAVSPPEAGTAGTGLSATPNAPSLSPSGGSAKYLALVITGTDGYTNMTFPSGYVELNQNQDQGVSLHIGMAFVESDTIDPGNGTISSEDWIAVTVAIPPATSVPTYYSATKDASWGVG